MVTTVVVGVEKTVVVLGVMLREGGSLSEFVRAIWFCSKSRKICRTLICWSTGSECNCPCKATVCWSRSRMDLSRPSKEDNIRWHISLFSIVSTLLLLVVVLVLVNWGWLPINSWLTEANSMSLWLVEQELDANGLRESWLVRSSIGDKDGVVFNIVGEWRWFGFRLASYPSLALWSSFNRSLLNDGKETMKNS